MQTPSNTPNNTPDPDNAWGPCPAGELERMATELRARDRRRQQLATAKNASFISAAVAAIVLAVGLTWQPSLGPLGGLTCNQCYAQFEQFEQTLTGEDALDNEQIGRMKAHLANCEICRSKFEEQYPGVLSEAGLAVSGASAANAVGYRLVLASAF